MEHVFLELKDVFNIQKLDFNISAQDVITDLISLKVNAFLHHGEITIKNNVSFHSDLIKKKEFAKFLIVKVISNGAAFNVVKGSILTEMEIV
jgi:hypothetical protein